MSPVIAEPKIETLPLEPVRELMRACLHDTPLGRLLDDASPLLGQGKMLRSRLTLRVGPAVGTDPLTLRHAAASIEVIHAASLLHDDVIDGGLLRRGKPSFWQTKGVAGAILLGDTLLIKGLDLVARFEDGRLTGPLVRFAGEVCQAEAEQELIYRHRAAQWADCERIARLKTGALFAFAGYAAAGTETLLQAALMEAGYEIGTAYQLADDLLDAVGDPNELGKTLGTDSARDKVTAASFLAAGHDPAAYVNHLCRSAHGRLAGWPAVQAAWDTYMQHDFIPALGGHLTISF